MYKIGQPCMESVDWGSMKEKQEKIRETFVSKLSYF